ncbi:uncharacterized protein LOC122369664 [Amphibalanus amphitrite]|nr:uncharacterized protein LOC122369664 [Amphibalanus amphitrite]
MSPPRHLRMVCHHIRRRANVLLPALLISFLLLVLLQDHDFQQPSMPHSQQWKARQPAAAVRDAAARAAVKDRQVEPDWVGSSDSAPVGPSTGQRSSGEEDTTGEKRSYVSGTRFVDFDPTAAESERAQKASKSQAKLNKLEKPIKTPNIQKSAPLSNDVLSASDDRAGGKDASVNKDSTNFGADLPVNTDSNVAPANGIANSPSSSGTNSGSSSLLTSTEEPLAGVNQNSHVDSPVSSIQPAVALDTVPLSGPSSGLEDKSNFSPNSSPDLDTGYYELPGCNCSRKYSKSAYLALNGTRSSCGMTADIRGAKQNVISFSFYGNASSVFFGGIEANLAKVPEIYPGWVVRVYNDINMSEPRQRELVCDVQCRYDNVDFCDVHDLPGLGDLSKKFGMIWRFMPLADDTVERFIVRDLDSLIGWRERAAVDDWIASNRTFHAMRDAPAHGTEILGGMWGGWNRYNSIYKRVRDRIIKVTQWRFKGLDQRVLTVVLWPLIQRHRDLIAHDSYLCYYYPMTRPFPTQRESPFDFVGSPSRIDKGFRLQSHCPYFCRPREHRDWEWC